MPFRKTSRRFRSTIFSLVLFALAMAQTLGAMHRIVHAPLAEQVEASADAGSPPAAPHWLLALFAGHTTEQGCHLYDQLSHADLLHVKFAALPALRPLTSPVAQPAARHLAADTAGSLARGPPLTS